MQSSNRRNRRLVLVILGTTLTGIILASYLNLSAWIMTLIFLLGISAAFATLYFYPKK